MSTARRVTAVCQDPGSARVIIPVVRELDGLGVSVKVIAAGKSVPIIAGHLSRVLLREADPLVTVDHVTALLEEFGTQVLFSAAGVYNQIEHTFRLAARSLGIRSVALVDDWQEYERRFGPAEDRRKDSFPDVVCALDDVSRQRLLELGIPPARVVITGPPNLEETIRRFGLVSQEECKSWRAKYDVRDGELTLVFFSEPLDSYGQQVYGYAAPEILGAILDQLQTERHRKATHLIVKAHPREDPEQLLPIVRQRNSSWLRVSPVTEGEAGELINVADVALGMSSIALLEAALLAGQRSASSSG